jgi:excisionase family DNA binding protein
MPSLDPVSAAEAAQLLSISKRTLHRRIGKGLIPAVKLSGATGAYVIDRKVINRLLVERQAPLQEAS